MKHKILFMSGVCIAAVISAPLAAFAAEKKSSSPSPSPSPSASPAAKTAGKQSTRPVPFHGMISAVDQKAKTFTIAGKEKSRVFKVTDKTVITRAGSAAAIKDIAENEEVKGSYWQNADGSLEAKTVNLGPAAKKTATSTASPSPSPKATPKPKPY